MKTTRTEERQLLCELTTSERIERGEQLGAVLDEISALEVEKAVTAKSYGAKIQLAKTKCEKLAKAVKSGQERRPVTCKILADVSRACYVTIREDTGSEEEARPMTSAELEHERQGDLDLPEPPLSAAWSRLHPGVPPAKGNAMRVGGDPFVYDGERWRADMRTLGKELGLTNQSKPKDAPEDEEKGTEWDRALCGDCVDYEPARNWCKLHDDSAAPRNDAGCPDWADFAREKPPKADIRSDAERVADAQTVLVTGSEDPADDGLHPKPPTELLEDDTKLGLKLDWLREHRYPVPVSTGRKARTAAMLSAIALGDYDEGAADQAFGPLKWPEPDLPASCPECGSLEPESCGCPPPSLDTTEE